jgi:predicted enzyme related to lactoylglutathione lyase
MDDSKTQSGALPQPTGGKMSQEMALTLKYAIQFVADMDQAVAFFRDTLGLTLSFQTPYWSEFASGSTKLALHPASPKNPAGKVQLGFSVPDLQSFFVRASASGLVFTQPPTQEEGALLARFLDPQGQEISISQG